MNYLTPVETFQVVADACAKETHTEALRYLQQFFIKTEPELFRQAKIIILNSFRIE